MRITANHRRIAAKKGWHDGHSKRPRDKRPYDEIPLCIEYEAAYWQGYDADKDAQNPYGFTDNDKHKDGYFVTDTGIAHWFTPNSKYSRCGKSEWKISHFYVSPLWTFEQREKIKKCSRCSNLNT